eukprot:scaffold299106_cov61-Attheya_sp.AAC.1
MVVPFLLSPFSFHPPVKRIPFESIDTHSGSLFSVDVDANSASILVRTGVPAQTVIGNNNVGNEDIHQSFHFPSAGGKCIPDHESIAAHNGSAPVQTVVGNEGIHQSFHFPSAGVQCIPDHELIAAHSGSVHSQMMVGNNDPQLVVGTNDVGNEGILQSFHFPSAGVKRTPDHELNSIHYGNFQLLLYRGCDVSALAK